MTNMTEGTSIGIGIDESATSDKRKLLQDEGMVDMPNMTNSTDMMEEGGKRKLLQEMMDEGMVDMPNMSNMTNSTDMMEEGGKRKLLPEMMEEGDTVTDAVTDTANDLVSSVGGRKLLQDM